MADEEDEWRFGLDDLEDEDTTDDTAETENIAETDDRAATTDDGESATDVVGGVGADQPIEPGSPRVENVVFVVLGVLLAMVLVADFLSVAGL